MASYNNALHKRFCTWIRARQPIVAHYMVKSKRFQASPFQAGSPLSRLGHRGGKTWLYAGTFRDWAAEETATWIDTTLADSLSASHSTISKK